MMVTWVRGHFKNVRGTLEFDPDDPARSSVEVEIDSAGIWTSEPQRDEHLRSADFLDAARHPKVTFRSAEVEVLGCNDFSVKGQLTIRGTTHPTTLRVRYLGQWATPWWENGVDKGPKIRAGFTAETILNRHAFGVSWNSPLEKGGGAVVGPDVHVTIDAEAILGPHAARMARLVSAIGG
jgi:polyisoprenoid-binding protein YceI